MRKIIFAIFIIFMVCNGVCAQSLGKMTLGCKRADIPLSLPRDFNICKTNTNNQLKYVNSKDENEYISFYLNNNIVYKIVMHKNLGLTFSSQDIKSKVEDIYVSLCDTWGEPTFVGENIYWQFPTSKGTFSYTVTTDQFYGRYGNIESQYIGNVDIKLEMRSHLFE